MSTPMTRPFLLLSLLTLCSAPRTGFAQAPSPEPAPASSLDSGLVSTNAWGSRGGMRLDAAHAIRAEAFVLAFASTFSQGEATFQPGDRFYVSTNRLSLVWSPWRRVEVALGYGFTASQWHVFANAAIQTLGSPSVTAKYSRDVAPDWAVGGMLQLLVPGSIAGSSLVPKASTLTVKALGSYQPIRRLELTANLGAILDGSGQLGDRNVLPNKRLTYGVHRGSGATLGVGALSQFQVKRVVGLGPFVELTGDILTLNAFTQNPIRATAGVNVSLLAHDWVELMLGADVRLAGAPASTSPYPGVLPWSVFGVLSLHLFDSPPAGADETLPCSDDFDCPHGQLCRNDICRFAVEVIKDVTSVERVREKMFTVSGTVVDETTAKPVDDVKVVFKGFEDTPVVPDRHTGAFHSFPLPAGDGLLPMTVTAPGYKPFEQVMPRGKMNEVVQIRVTLRQVERADVGTLRGSLNDNRRGRPVSGTVTVVDLGQTIATNELGQFNASVKTGVHTLLIAADGYVSQNKRLVLHDGEVIILNIDMARRHGHQHRRRN